MQKFARWLDPILLAGLGACAPVAAAARNDLAGRWHGCLTNANVKGKPSACGSVTVVADTTARPARVPDYWLSYDIALERVLTDRPQALPAFGTLSRDADSIWTFTLGVPAGISESADDASLYGELVRRGTALIGRWRRNCDGACRDSGSIVLRR